MTYLHIFTYLHISSHILTYLDCSPLTALCSQFWRPKTDSQEVLSGQLGCFTETKKTHLEYKCNRFNRCRSNISGFAKSISETGDSSKLASRIATQNGRVPEDFLPASEMRHTFHRGNKSKVELHLGQFLGCRSTGNHNPACWTCKAKPYRITFSSPSFPGINHQSWYQRSFRNSQGFFFSQKYAPCSYKTCFRPPFPMNR